MASESERQQRGLAALAAITGGTGAAVVESLKDIAPDLADWIVAFSYGDVMSRPGLDLKSRQFATVALLASLPLSTRSTWLAKCSGSAVSRSGPDKSLECKA